MIYGTLIQVAAESSVQKAVLNRLNSMIKRDMRRIDAGKKALRTTVSEANKMLAELYFSKSVKTMITYEHFENLIVIVAGDERYHLGGTAC